MLVPVLTAVSDTAWEARLVAALARGDLGVQVVRRCVDLADLLATAATGQAAAVLLSADLRRLDRDALSRLSASGVAVVGLVPPGDEQAEVRLRQLGVRGVLPSDATAEVIAAAVLEAVVAVHPSPGDLSALAEPRAALRVGVGDGLPEPTGPPAGSGAVIAVWGPAGAPGRSTVAMAVASELAALGWSSLLVDADPYGGVLAQLLGLLDESPGLAAACRQAGAGSLDVPTLMGLARQLSPTLRVLSGIARADRWPELSPASLDVVLELARSVSATTVVDVGFCLEQDEELSYDTLAPRRNGATLTVLEQADTVVAVGSADPVGLQRLVRGLGDLREAVPGVVPRVVVNRLRSSAVPGSAADEVRGALLRYAGVEQVHLVPSDVAGVDAAVAGGRTLLEACPGSPARIALQGLAASLVGAPGPVRRRRLLRR